MRYKIPFLGTCTVLHTAEVPRRCSHLPEIAPSCLAFGSVLGSVAHACSRLLPTPHGFRSAYLRSRSCCISPPRGARDGFVMPLCSQPEDAAGFRQWHTVKGARTQTAYTALIVRHAGLEIEREKPLPIADSQK